MSAQSASRQPRGEARRRCILDATLRIVGREGAGAVTHRAVAAEAGVPLAATTYYFSSREELLAETLEHTAQADIAELARGAALLAAPPLTVETLSDRLCGLVLDWLGGNRPTLIAQYEICLEAARRPELFAMSRQWSNAYVAAISPTLAALGCDDPARDSRLVFATLTGLVIDELSGPQPDFEHAVLRPTVERLVRGLVV